MNGLGIIIAPHGGPMPGGDSQEESGEMPDPFNPPPDFVAPKSKPGTEFTMPTTYTMGKDGMLNIVSIKGWTYPGPQDSPEEEAQEGDEGASEDSQEGRETAVRNKFMELDKNQQGSY